MTTLKPPPRSASSARAQRREWLRSVGWLALAILCFGLLLFFLANPGSIARLIERWSPFRTANRGQLPRIVPQGDSAREFPSGADGFLRGDPHAAAEGSNAMEPVVARLPAGVASAGEKAGLAAPGRLLPEGVLKIARITPEVMTSPRYALVSGPDKPFVPGTWIQVEVEFRAATDLPRGIIFRYTLDLGGAVHVGDVTHGPIFAGERLFTVAYLRPRALALFLRYGPFPSKALRNVRIDVLSGGRLLDTAALRSDAIQAQSVIRGFVVDSASTPFAPLLGDRYEPLAR